MALQLNPTFTSSAFSSQTFFKKPLSPALKGFLFTLALFVAGFIFFRPYYLGNDDSLASMMSEGIGHLSEGGSEYLFEINVLVGLGLKGLNYVWPGFHWYGLFLYALFYLSTWAMATSIFNNAHSHLKLLAVLSVLALSFLRFFSKMEFTLLAFWTAQAGILLFLGTNRFDGHGKKLFLISGGLLFFLSSLVRFHTAILGILVAIPMFIYHWHQGTGTQKKRIFGWLTIILSLSISSFFFNLYYFGSHAGWGYYYPWISAEHKISEYSDISVFASNRQLLSSVEWDPLDYSLFHNCYWQDDKFSLENLEKLQKELPPDPRKKFLVFSRCSGMISSESSCYL